MFDVLFSQLFSYLMLSDIKEDEVKIMCTLELMSSLLENHSINILTGPEVKAKIYSDILPFALKFTEDYYKDYKSDFGDNMTAEQFLLEWVVNHNKDHDVIVKIANNALRNIVRILQP